MRFLLFNFEYPPLGGGGGVATKQIAEELARRHEVTVITTRYRGLPHRERCNGVDIVRVPVIGRRKMPTASLLSLLTFVPTASVAALWLGWRQKFDVINAQFALPSGIPAAIAAKILSIPLVVSFIGGDIYDPTKGVSPHRHALLRWLIRLISKQAAICTAISRDTQQRAQQLHGVTCEIVVTHLGLIPTVVPPTTRSELGLPADAKVAVTIGRLIPRKSHHLLVEALASIPGVHLYVIGAGPLKKKLNNLVAERELSERVHLVGYVSEERKLQLLRAADLYVSAAEHEGFGIVFLEAMEAGLPIVAVNEGGQTDFLTDGENALLVEPHNQDALTQAIRRLLDDSGLAQRLADNNRQKVKSFYVTHTVKEFEHVLVRAHSLHAKL